MKTSVMIGVLALVAGQAAGQCGLQKTRPNDANQGDEAGYSVAVDGDLLLIGTALDDEKGLDAGAVHVMNRPYGSWDQIAKLKSVYTQAGDEFGYSVAFDGTYALIGSPYASPYGQYEAGTATVFFHWGDAWFESQRLLIDGYSAGDWAGTAVAMSGPWAVIGAPGDSNGRGSITWVTIDQNGTFTPGSEMVAPDGADYALFGGAVAMDGKWAVVGASNANDGNMLGCGEAYVYLLYKQGYWNPDQIIQPVDRSEYDAFGSSVAIDGDLMVVGAPMHDGDTWQDSGAAYIYRYNGAIWALEQEIFGDDKFYGEEFGYKVSIANGRVYVSTGYEGQVYVFEKTQAGWKNTSSIVDPDGPYAGWFGSALATDGKTLAIGDCLDDYTILNLSDTGAVYTETFEPPCIADFNSDGVTDLFDFLAFQNAFVSHEWAADLDCNGLFNLFDFLAYQNNFVAGCH